MHGAIFRYIDPVLAKHFLRRNTADARAGEVNWNVRLVTGRNEKKKERLRWIVRRLEPQAVLCFFIPESPWLAARGQVAQVAFPLPNHSLLISVISRMQQINLFALKIHQRARISQEH
jgi:hypothetical protein